MSWNGTWMGWRWLPSPLSKGGSQRSLWIFPYVLCVFVYLCLYICGHKCEHVSTCTNLTFHVSGPHSPLTLFQRLDSLEMREPGSTPLVFCRNVWLWNSQVGQAVHFSPGSVSSVKLWGVELCGRRWEWGEESQESQRLSFLSCGECKCCLPGSWNVRSRICRSRGYTAASQQTDSTSLLQFQGLYRKSFSSD